VKGNRQGSGTMSVGVLESLSLVAFRVERASATPDWICEHLTGYAMGHEARRAASGWRTINWGEVNFIFPFQNKM